MKPEKLSKNEVKARVQFIIKRNKFDITNKVLVKALTEEVKFAGANMNSTDDVYWNDVLLERGIKI